MTNMLQITPISFLDILLSLTYLLLLLISAGIVLVFITTCKMLSDFNPLSKMIFILILGMAFITVVSAVIAYFHIFTRQTIIILSLAMMSLGLSILLTSKSIRKEVSNVSKEKFYYGSLFIIAIALLWLRMALIFGIYTYPGDDPKLYALISRRIIEEQGIPHSWGKYAFNEWIAEKIHLYMLGMPFLVASTSLMLDIPIYKSLTIVTQITVWISILSLAVLSEILWGNKYVTLLTMIIYGLLTTEPTLTWISWGGNAELCALTYLPILISLPLMYLKGLINFRAAVLFESLLIASAIVTHPFVIIYFIVAFAAIASVHILSMQLKRLMRLLLLIICSGAISLAFGMPILPYLIQEEFAVKGYYEPSINPGWTPIFTSNQDLLAALSSFIHRILNVYGPMVFLIFPTFILVITRKIKHSKEDIFAYLYLVFWWFFLFFLHENNPNGLWLIRFPLWYRIDANRTFAITSAPTALFISAVLGKVLSKNIKKPIDDKVLFRVFLTISILCNFVFSFMGHPLIQPYLMFDENDAKIFPEILKVTSNEYIFVFPNDAGQWIPSMLGIPVILPMGVATKHHILNEYYLDIYPTMVIDPCSPKVADFFAKYNISYIYRGSKQGHLELYPHVLNKTLTDNCKVLEPVIFVRNAVLYKYHKPSITKSYEIRLENPIIWHEQSKKFTYEDHESVLTFHLNNSWIAILIDLNNSLTNQYFDLNKLIYADIYWRTDENVRLVIEALYKNNTLTRLRGPLYAEAYFKWGNGTITWIHEYVRIPVDVVQIRIILEGSGKGELSKKIQFFEVMVDV